jgi:hypothetical protein
MVDLAVMMPTTTSLNISENLIETPPIEGGCQCGALRYTIGLRNLVSYVCHCSECKKQSSSSFAVSVPIPAKYFQLTGNAEIYKRATDSGTKTNCYFCPSCGTRIYHQSERSPDVITLKGGTLDDISSLPTLAHLWTKRKQVWMDLPTNIETHETQPSNLKQWRDALMANLKPI